MSVIRFLYRQHQVNPYFKRLHDGGPVHYQKSSPFGAFWSVTRYLKILSVDKITDIFSTESRNYY